MRAWLALFLLPLLALASAGPASAGDGDGDGDAARAVITRQVEAFGRDDAQTAYAQAAPAIQDLFPNADLFIGMVRNQYAPVYRHRSFVFGETREAGEAGLIQAVAIQDAYGVDWTAEYSLVRDVDGRWRISGCRLVKAPGTSA